ncbi:MAG TPA: nucleoside hydrolase [Anaerolineales bacterium]|nr:nucleoside hydrolase [Anaerolineales bacterium]
MALDDWIAILYVLQHPDVEVIAITVTGTGEAHCGPGVAHALELVYLAGEAGIPVTCGREFPLEGNHAFPDDLRARVDELAGLDLPDSPESPASQGAVELMTDLISNSGTRITILTLGPLTNLGEALGAEPALAQEIEMVYIMGGAVSVPGNLAFAGIDNQVSEWNIYIDPKAAQLVLDSGAPLTLIPLDVTNLAPLTVDFLDRLGEVAQTPEAEFVFRSLTQYSEFIAQGYYFWDPLAAAALTDEESFTFEALELQVILEDGSHSGQTIQQGEGASVRVAIGVDNRQFEQLLIDVLNSE